MTSISPQSWSWLPSWRPRRLHAYGLGPPKSGTQSLAAMFAGGYRAVHEPLARPLIDRIVAADRSPAAAPELARFVRRMERHHRWELNSSQLNGHVLEVLLATFPRARFVLTIRDCYAWLDSYVNHHLAAPASPTRQALRDLRFRPDLHPHRAEEKILEQRGLYSIDGCLAYWARHHRQVLDAVPADRLLVVRTDELAVRAGAIAAFLGVPAATLDVARAHSHRAARRFHLLAELDRGFLEDRVRHHGGELMQAWFPEIRSFTESAAARQDSTVL